MFARELEGEQPSELGPKTSKLNSYLPSGGGVRGGGGGGGGRGVFAFCFVVEIQLETTHSPACNLQHGASPSSTYSFVQSGSSVLTAAKKNNTKNEQTNKPISVVSIYVHRGWGVRGCV
jgi:hypothetical protein